MPLGVVDSRSQSIRSRLVTSFALIFLAITIYGLYISKSTQQAHQNLVKTQEYDEQYALLWNLKYDNRVITGKTRGVLFNVANRTQLRHEYELATAEYEQASAQLVLALNQQHELGRLSEINALASELRGDESRIFSLVDEDNAPAASRF